MMSALITVESLQKLIAEKIQHNRISWTTEIIHVSDAVGRVLAEDIIAEVSIPNADISAMDGYALLGPLPVNSTLEIVGESVAGKAFSGQLSTGQAVRIMTGAHVPDVCTTVIIQENTKRENNSLTLLADAKPKANIRYQGEVVNKGEQVLDCGKVLTIADVLLLSSLGRATVCVQRKIKVAVFSTGNELQEPGTQIQVADKIFDSNRYMLMAKLKTMSVDVIDLGISEDSLEGIMTMLRQAANLADVVITSGGASVGDYDFIYEAVSKIGTIHHYKVAMKPGKPFVFGSLEGSLYFGLPGNPVSGFAGFEVFIRHAIMQMAAQDATPHILQFRACLTHDVQKSIGRKEYQRAHITCNQEGIWQVTILKKQESHNILGASQANAFAILPADGEYLSAGEGILVQPFRDCFI